MDKWKVYFINGVDLKVEIFKCKFISLVGCIEDRGLNVENVIEVIKCKDSENL